MTSFPELIGSGNPEAHDWRYYEVAREYNGRELHNERRGRFIRFGIALATAAIVFSAAMLSGARADTIICKMDNNARTVCPGPIIKSKVKHPVDANGNRVGGLAIIRSASGHIAKVAARYREQFQALVDDLEAAGYRIDFMGGWRRWGSCKRCDAHPNGRAIDINQTARNRVTRKFPADVTRIAASHGICHGAIWGNADRGHFEVASASRSTACREIGARHWPRVVKLEPRT